MKRLFINLLLIAAIVGFFMFKHHVKENEKRQSEENTKAYAIGYIEEKYGFTPELKKIELDSRNGAFNLQYNGMIIAEMSYNGKDFLVWIGDDGSDGRDSYQQDEIVQAFVDKLKEKTPSIISVDLITMSPMFSNNYPDVILTGQKYTGDNLQEVLNENMGSYHAYLVGTENARRTPWNINSNYYGEYIVYRSEKGLEEFPGIDSSTRFRDPENFEKYVLSWSTTQGTSGNTDDPDKK